MTKCKTCIFAQPCTICVKVGVNMCKTRKDKLKHGGNDWGNVGNYSQRNVDLFNYYKYETLCLAH